MSALSVADVAAAGIGFDIVGALALASGLFVSPDQQARRLQSAGNTFAVFRVEDAEGRADGEIGGSLLVAGFALQALAYAMIAGGFRGVSHVDGATDVAILSTVTTLCLGLLIAEHERPRRTKTYLVRLAHYDDDGLRDDYPGLEELARYAAVLGYPMTTEEIGDYAATAAFVKRVFGVPSVRRRVPPSQVL